MITWSEEGFPLRNGLRLGSHQEPEAEANKWLQSLDLLPWAQPVILGLGGHFHVAAFRTEYPEQKLTVLDVDKDLVKNHSFAEAKICSIQILSLKNLPTELNHWLETLPGQQTFQLLDFTPAWASRETEFQMIKSFLLGRHAPGQIFNQKIKRNPQIHAQLRAVSPELELNFKSLLTIQGDPLSDLEKSKSILKELIR